MSIKRIVDRTFPLMDASSAVAPTVRESGETLDLAYYRPGCESSAVVRFSGVARWSYGYPNDEGLSEHPLYGRGLKYYEFHAVPSEPSSDLIRWIATFHDGTFEVEASAVTVVAKELGDCGPFKALSQFGAPGEIRQLDG